jgi:hypothetical protein
VYEKFELLAVRLFTEEAMANKRTTEDAILAAFQALPARELQSERYAAQLGFRDAAGLNGALRIHVLAMEGVVLSLLPAGSGQGLDTDKKGYLEAEELQRLMTTYGEKFSADEV